MEGFDTPILFLIFNRPDLTEIVFKRIREVKPKFLYIAADGPRLMHPQDFEKCQQARETVLNLIDWKCEINTLFRDENLGCGRSVGQAISWFFEHVDDGIILEDDCFPSFSFFPFCSELLEFFRFSENIMHISGGCYIPKKYLPVSSYYFSKYPFIWGWATWRRAWEKFNFDLIMENTDEILKIHDSKIEIDYWRKVFDKINNQELDTWDFRWNFSIWKENGVSVTSTENLVKNIGFREDSTHVKSINPYYKKQSFSDSNLQLPLLHPNKVEIDRNADALVFERYNLGKIKNSMVKRIINKIYGRF